MEDPLPSNITGEKRVVHTVEHRINWGYALLGAAGIAALWLIFGGDGGADASDVSDAVVDEAQEWDESE